MPVYGKVAGSLLFVAGAQFLIGMLIATALHAGYSVANNYISDLGVGSTALVFNLSVIVLGVLNVAASYFLYRGIDSRLLSVLVGLNGIGAIGVGVFPETTGAPHGVSALIAFLFGALAAIASFRQQKSPFSIFSIILGVLSLVSLVLFAAGVTLGLGVGGIERMIAYPAIVWAVVFGGYLAGTSEK